MSLFNKKMSVTYKKIIYQNFMPEMYLLYGLSKPEI